MVRLIAHDMNRLDIDIMNKQALNGINRLYIALATKKCG